MVEEPKIGSTEENDAVQLFAFEYPPEWGSDRVAQLSEDRIGELNIRVINIVGFPLRARFSLNVQDEALSNWLTTQEAPEQEFTIGGSQVFTIEARVPLSVQPGDYRFRIDVLDLALPDETLTPSDLITVRVPTCATSTSSRRS